MPGTQERRDLGDPAPPCQALAPGPVLCPLRGRENLRHAAAMALEIRPMCAADADNVIAIFAMGIATGNATFDQDPGTWETWTTRFLPRCRLIAEAGEVQGWAALSSISKREVYRGIGEVSLYVAESARGQGVGHALMEALISVSEDAGFWTLQAHIFPENAASLALHRRFGFRDVGRRERLGLMSHGPWASTWRDVMVLERRSAKFGF